MNTRLFDNEPITDLLTFSDELNYVREALEGLQDRLTDEEYLSSLNAKQLVRKILYEGVQMAFFIKRFEALIEHPLLKTHQGQVPQAGAQ